MLDWIARFIMLAAGIIAGWFVPKDDIGYSVIAGRRRVLLGDYFSRRAILLPLALQNKCKRRLTHTAPV